MSYRNLVKAAALAAPVLLAGCVDSKYDLNDLDKTMRVEVKDLVLPVNLDPIKLDDAIDFNSGDDMIRSVKDASGKEFYAFVQKGKFNTDSDIELARVKVDEPDMQPKTEEFNLSSLAPASSRRKAPGVDDTFQYDMKFVHSEFNYTSTPLPKELSAIKAVGTTPFSLALSLKVNDPNGVMDEITFKNVHLALPAGLTTNATNYNKATGEWIIDEMTAVNGEVKLGLDVTAINLKAAGAEFDNAACLNFNGTFDITEGEVFVKFAVPSSASTFTPDPTIVVDINYNVGGFEIASITGTVDYADPFSIDPISLSGLPSFLLDRQTVIEMANPQLYLQVNNPVGNDGVSPKANLSLTAIREGNASPIPFSPSSPINLGTNAGDGPYSFILAPRNENLNVPAGPDAENVNYNLNQTYIPFPGLSDLLAPEANTGESDMVGLPKSIAVDLAMPPMTVNDFAILPASGAEAKVLPKIDGHYYIMAPLALNDGSTIVYSDIVDGWGDEDLDKLVITGLSITSDADNQLPVKLEVTIYPLTYNHKRIGDSFMSAQIPAMTAQPLDFTLKLSEGEEITRLDGIEIYAVLKGHDGSPLSPEQILTLNNLKIKVSGHYNVDLDDDK